MSAESPSNITPNKSYRNPRTTFENTPFSAHSAGEGGVPEFLCGLESFYFSELPMHNFGTLRQFLNSPPLSPHICDSAKSNDNFLKYPPCLSKYFIVWGVWGVPKFCCRLESFYFSELGANAKFRNPTIILNLPPLSPQICDSAGGRVGPRFFLKLES